MLWVWGSPQEHLGLVARPRLTVTLTIPKYYGTAGYGLLQPLIASVVQPPAPPPLRQTDSNRSLFKVLAEGNQIFL